METPSKNTRLWNCIVSLFACALSSLCAAVTLVAPGPAHFDPAAERSSELAEIPDLYRAQAYAQIAGSGRNFAREIQNQFSNQIDELMQKYFLALSVENDLQDFLEAAVRDLSLEESVDSISGNTKSWQSIIEKAFLRDKFRGTKITDIARKKIVFKDGSISQLMQLAKYLEQSSGLEIVEELEDNFRQPKSSGYRDVKLKFTFKGVVVELIFTFSSIDQVASEERREVYEKERSGKFVSQIVKKKFYNLYRIATLVALSKPVFGIAGLR